MKRPIIFMLCLALLMFACTISTTATPPTITSLPPVTLPPATDPPTATEPPTATRTANRHSAARAGYQCYLQ